jgi:ribonuclease VapC
MIVDSSALVAVVLEEPHAVPFLVRMRQATTLSVSAVTLAEASMVLLSRGGQVKVDILDALLERLEVKVVPVDRTQSLLAREAFDRYGKGRATAGLNLGDCFAYALAKHYAEPLLFQGNDFIHTDLVLA